MSSPRVLGYLALLSLSLTAPAQAALFGIQSDSDSIVEIDPTTGAILRGFPAPDPNLRALIGLSGAENGSVLLWEDSYGETTLGRITRIDPISGAVLGYFNSSFAIAEGLTSERIAGTDYLIVGGRGNGLLVQRGYGSTDIRELDLGSVVTSLGGDGFGRSFAACRDDTFREFDPVTGSVLQTFPFLNAVRGLAFDGQYLYATNQVVEDHAFVTLLYTVDPDTAQILRTVTVTGGPIQGLAVAIPEPSLLTLILIPAALTRVPRR